MWRSALVVTCVLAGCTDDGRRSASGSSASGPFVIDGAVPWASAPPPAVDTASTTAAPTVTAPACRSEDVDGELVDGGAGLGNQLTVVVLINVGASACSVTGALELRATTDDGTSGPVELKGGGTYFGDPGPPRDLAPGQAAEAYIGTGNTCTDSPGVHLHDLVVEVPGGGQTPLEDGRLDAMCPFIRASSFGFDPRWYLRFLSATGPSDLDGHVGEPLLYPVTLTNRAPVAVRLDPCPDYSEILVGPTATPRPKSTGTLSYGLNCKDATPIPAFGSETFTMMLPVPADWTTDGTVLWELEQTSQSTEMRFHLLP